MKRPASRRMLITAAVRGKACAVGEGRWEVID